MSMRYRFVGRSSVSLSFGLLAGLLFVLCLVGGASRADVLGQALSRAAALIAILTVLIVGERPQSGGRHGLYYLMAAIVALPCLQLIPLPPELWQALPGREAFQFAATGAQPWRPLSIRPSATLNAAGSLIVPIAVVFLAAGVDRREWDRVITVILILAGVSAIAALIQVSGSPIGSPVVNFTPGAVSGLFANRNHFALFLALGSLIAPVWAVRNREQISWRLPFAAGLMLFFFLLILASGSRAGIVTGLLGSLIGLLMIRRDLTRAFRRVPKWGIAALVIGTLSATGLLIWFSITSDRAESVNRVIAMTTSEDMRTLAFSTVVEMIGAYFPVGSGMGGFDAMFRLHEPFALLQPKYFNHAHNDFAEIAIDGGIAAIAILFAALAWYAVKTFRVWRARPSEGVDLGRMGSALLLLIILASVVDYPARTPMMMAIIALAAFWVNRGARENE